MLRIFRMWRYVRAVNKENKNIAYKDKVLVGFYEDEECPYVSQNEVEEKFRVFARDTSKKRHISERVRKAVIAKGYIIPHNDRGVIVLELNPDKGDDFVSLTGLVKGLFRELKFYEQLVATGLAFGSLYGIYNLLLALIDKIRL